MATIKRVISAVSGGIDSAVSTLLLKNKGYEVIGVYMQNWDLLDEKGVCSSQNDISDAEWVCQKIGIPFHVVNFVKEYWLEVFSNLVNDYESGLTPNPDILCNRHIKFEAFYKHATEELGGDAISTGHYARTTFGEYLQNFDSTKGVHLLKARDERKDQTFFLSQIHQRALQRSIFPLGDMKKSAVKKFAAAEKFAPLLKKKESMGICFIGSRNFQEFISEYVTSHPGNFVDVDSGKIVGRHDGIHQWTIGQRSRIGGCKEPFYIVEKDPSTQNIYVAMGTRHPALYTDLVMTDTPHWIHSPPPQLVKDGVLDCDFRFQHTHSLLKCQVFCAHSGRLIIRLAKPLRAITPGQYAVLYLDEECLGSARITTPGPTLHALGVNSKGMELDCR
ncbi:mitochondrial tRNA-specific 2-thiouridylase 1 isoform X1 [Ischnura elegans]|uniref:mitochondrial tRNA-specific 2-thiouridylase 1 isoform X1 n=1 Tax=Ischnura elegans TaxID=197161 RepID=UPI001ED884DF|nr:mitochondrial tRNA-specific 2-thiouridylase 1 isoform X1 [Ischnura elegans]XP_046402251.1 mitochondrial tRNA-specific 2-thiouridylase 1 isoform X1 [Ischnura elegans]